jgi:hypothetical protein
MGVAIDEVAHRSQVRGVLGQRRPDGRFERMGAMAVEELREAAGEDAQVRAAAGGSEEERLGAGGCVLQAVLRAMGAGRALLGGERLDMHAILDLRPAIEAARVGG